MDSDIIEYCIKTIAFINNNNNNYEKIIALILREINENDVVYIKTKSVWYKYDKKIKKWNKYNFKLSLAKTSELYQFFDEILIKYLDEHNNTLSNSNKNKFKRVSKLIASHILDYKINMNKLYNECCDIFKIDKNI